MLLIGSYGRNVGKTLLGAMIINKFKSTIDIIGIKVTAIDHTSAKCHRGGEGCGVCSSIKGNYLITEETDPSTGKDTSRLLAAGAKRVFWLRVLKSHLAQGIEELTQMIGPDAISICESNSLRQVVEPSVFLMLKNTTDLNQKESSKQVAHYADRNVIFNGDDFDIDQADFELIKGSWAVKAKAAAIIMAGGQSKRMGQDKSMLEFDGKPMIQHTFEKLKPHFSQLLISANDKSKYSFLDALVVPDKAQGCGPLMGIACAVEASSYDLNFVIACDIPEFDIGLIKKMIWSSHGFDVVIPRKGTDKNEPLFGLYNKSILANMNNAIDSGRRKIIDAFEGAKVKYLDIDENTSLINLNTMDDYIEFKG